MPRPPKRRCFAAGCEYIRTEYRACDDEDRRRKRLHRFPKSAQIVFDMASLVADYGSSSESENESGSEKGFEVEEKKEVPPPQLEKLPLPDFAAKAKSVFSNPYVEAERAKQAVLEKHVKMIPTRDDIKEINGKQICWNYRKGRCRFGHNCKFAHDSDLFQGNVSGSDVRHTDNTPMTGAHPDEPLVEAESELSQEVPNSNRKKRPGLSQTLIPGKKVLKMYKKQREKDSPWRD